MDAFFKNLILYQAISLALYYIKYCIWSCLIITASTTFSKCFKDG